MEEENYKQVCIRFDMSDSVERELYNRLYKDSIERGLGVGRRRNIKKRIISALEMYYEQKQFQKELEVINSKLDTLLENVNRVTELDADEPNGNISDGSQKIGLEDMYANSPELRKMMEEG